MRSGVLYGGYHFSEDGMDSMRAIIVNPEGDTTSDYLHDYKTDKTRYLK